MDKSYEKEKNVCSCILVIWQECYNNGSFVVFCTCRHFPFVFYLPTFPCTAANIVVYPRLHSFQGLTSKYLVRTSKQNLNGFGIFRPHGLKSKTAELLTDLALLRCSCMKSGVLRY